MSFLNTVAFFCEMTSKIAEQGFNEDSKLKLKEFKKFQNLTFVNHLPEFSKDYIELATGRANVGFVVRRPLKAEIVTKLVKEYHYGVVLGTDESGEELLIEMTDEGNVRLVSKSKFLSKYGIKRLEIDCATKNISRHQIIERAKEYEFDIYSLLDLNCKDFAYYCACGIKPKKRSTEFKKLALELNSFAINFRKMQVASPENKGNTDFLKRTIENLEKEKHSIKESLAKEEKKDKK